MSRKKKEVAPAANPPQTVFQRHPGDPEAVEEEEKKLEEEVRPREKDTPLQQHPDTKQHSGAGMYPADYDEAGHAEDDPREKPDLVDPYNPPGYTVDADGDNPPGGTPPP